MSKATGSQPGFPPFEPPLSALTSLTTTIQASVTEYAHARTPKEKAAALQRIQSYSAKLAQATTPIQQQFMEINFRPNLNVAIRIGVEMGLFVCSLSSHNYCKVLMCIERSASHGRTCHRRRSSQRDKRRRRVSFPHSSNPCRLRHPTRI